MPSKSAMVHSDPEILGGTPVFVGTRVPVKTLYDYLEAGDTLDEFARAELLGCTVVPISGGMTSRQVQFLRDLGAQVLAATPSYALSIADAIEAAGLGRDELKLEIGVFGAEPWTEAMRDEIQRRLGIVAICTGCPRSLARACRPSATRDAPAPTSRKTTSCPRLSIRIQACRDPTEKKASLFTSKNSRHLRCRTNCALHALRQHVMIVQNPPKRGTFIERRRSLRSNAISS